VIVAADRRTRRCRPVDSRIVQHPLQASMSSNRQERCHIVEQGTARQPPRNLERDCRQGTHLQEAASAPPGRAASSSRCSLRARPASSFCRPDQPPTSPSDFQQEGWIARPSPRPQLALELAAKARRSAAGRSEGPGGRTACWAVRRNWPGSRPAAASLPRPGRAPHQHDRRATAAAAPRRPSGVRPTSVTAKAGGPPVRQPAGA